jgi:hypothetical protein
MPTPTRRWTLRWTSDTRRKLQLSLNGKPVAWLSVWELPKFSCYDRVGQIAHGRLLRVLRRARALQPSRAVIAGQRSHEEIERLVRDDTKRLMWLSDELAKAFPFKP